MTTAEIQLDELIDGFAKFKQAIGCSYESQIYYLHSFREFCKSRGCRDIPGKSEFVEWAKLRPEEQPQTQRTRISPVRQLYLYMFDTGLEVGFVLPKMIGVKGEKYRPHFLREEEINHFFNACDNLKVRKENPCREVILPVAFRLMYCCGLRPIETIRLKSDDVNLQEGYIDIIDSKCHNNRRLFITKELTGYLSDYSKYIGSIWPLHEYFFPKGTSGHYFKHYLSDNFKKIWRSLDIANDSGRVRLYDVRHHFAFANINRWFREGKDANTMVAYLSRFMGHTSLECTYYYIHLVPDFYGDYTNSVKSLSALLPEVEYED